MRDYWRDVPEEVGGKRQRPTVEELKQRIAELEDSLRAKNDLIANMSRELNDLRYLGGL